MPFKESGQPSRSSARQSAEAEQPMNEGFAAQGQLGSKQSNKTEHGHPAVQFFGAVVETPSLRCFNNFHAGFRSKGVEAAAVFHGDLCTAHDRSGGRGLGHGGRSWIAKKCKPGLRNVQQWLFSAGC